MGRSSRRGIGVLAMVMGVAVPVGSLVLLFTVMDPGTLSSRWPMGIRSTEVDRYAQLFDRRVEDEVTAKPERYFLSAQEAVPCIMEHTGAGWTPHWFEAEGFGDSVKVRRLRTAEGGFLIKFRREEPFRAQRHIVLIPANASSIRAKYLEVLAAELGLVTPEVSFVRVIACGADQGIFLKEERIDLDFLEKNKLAGASFFEQGFDAGRPDHLYPAFEDDTLAGKMVHHTLDMAYSDMEAGNTEGLPYLVDAKATVGRLLMHWIEEGSTAFTQDDLFAYRWSTGRIVPLYRRARGREEGVERATSPIMLNFFTAALKDRSMRELLRTRRAQLIEERWRMKERFAGMDRAWLPILAQGGSLAVAKARAADIQNELIGTRLDSEVPLQVFERPLVRGVGAASFGSSTRTDQRYWPTADDATILQRIAAKHKALVRGDTIIFLRGRYSIEEDLTIPYGRTVILDQGARFEIAEGKSVVIQGPLIVRGTQRNPVFVRPMRDAEPFGSFAVVGDGTTRCIINGLQVSGGREARVNGVYFSGMFAIHNAAEVGMNDCVISGSRGEDAFNVKGGVVAFRNCVFEDGYADLVDLDFCTGSIAACAFRSGHKDSNGDGLDVSGSRVLVEQCSFERMMDKGISVGEASQLLVRRSRFIGNKLAIAAKDLSIAYVIDNVFTDNATVFGAYRKKPIYGGARVMRYANEYYGNTKDQQVDSLSAVVPSESMDPKVLAIFGLE